jgi:Fe-S-cluster containining protein
MSNLPACCLDLDIDLMDLLDPERLPAVGREFLDAHGLGALTPAERDALIAAGHYLGAGVIKLRHRCAQLQDDGRCAVYASRPAICRNFDCSTRHDCACGGAGFVATTDLEFERA